MALFLTQMPNIDNNLTGTRKTMNEIAYLIVRMFALNNDSVLQTVIDGMRSFHSKSDVDL
jgi:hypothetical protein